MESLPSKKKDRVLTQEAFDNFLDWLNKDRELAGKKYEELRRKLIKIFTYRGCSEAEDLADETINRVVKKVEEIKNTYIGDPVPYFYGVAHNVHLEYLREKARVAQPLPNPSGEIEQEYECLEQCMERLTPQNRELILQYYQGEKRVKIDHRRKLAQSLGIELNALRIRTQRIRVNLKGCIRNCLAQIEAA